MKKITIFAAGWRQRRTLPVFLLTLAGICLFSQVSLAQTTFTNSAAITIADATQTAPGLSNPYPSVINVTGLTGTITDVNVRINGLTHTFPGDLGIIVVAPGGQTMVIQGIAGDDPNVVNLTYTIDDQAAEMIPELGPILAQSYRPSSYVPGLFFPASGANPPPTICQTSVNCPNPATVGTATLAGTFNGTNPNGAWRLYAADFGPIDIGNISGGWSLIITTSGGGGGGVMQFIGPTYTTSESPNSATITVNRTGDTTGASSVDYSTGDNFTFVGCEVANGMLNQRCDYTATRGTLNFAAGETSKTFTIPLAEDFYVEGNESVNLALSNPTGGTIGTQGTAMLTITDNDTTAPGNRLFFARLSSAEEVPTNNSTATGSGTVLLNDAENQITVNMNFTGLSSTQTAAHIHAAAHVGVNAPVLFNLGLGTITNATFPITAAQVAQLKAGLMYFNVHSQNFTGGEIRGQILPNPSENQRLFVRRQYADFLSREPDQAGFDFWSGQIINTCGTDLACIRQRRTDVSNAFFFELEFQQTGAYVFRLYRAAYGNTQPQPNPESMTLPNYSSFVADRARVIGSASLTQRLQDLANSFVTRTDFTTRYPAAQTPTQFVDALLANIMAASGANLASQRDALIALASGAGGRGAVMYRIAEDAQATNPINNRAFIDAEYNRAFVATQYFGFLRRDPDFAGFNFWLNIVNGFPLRSPTGQNRMVCAFITSEEYQRRFNSYFVHTNAECPAN